MADLVLAEKDPATVLSQALALYKQLTISAANPTGITLAPADPRRLHLQALLALVTQLRQQIDFSGKQSLLRFVSDLWIEALAELYGDPGKRLPPKPSKTVERFSFASASPRIIPKGTRVTDDVHTWTVTEDTSGSDDHIDAPVECTITGSATNGVAVGQIDTLQDPSLVPGCTGVSNLSETISGREIEALEDYRARLRDLPESSSTAGPRSAYEALSLALSSSAADAVALGPDDGDDMAGTPPGACEVFVFLLEGARDDDGVLTSVIPDPSSGLISEIQDGLSAETVRPLTDKVTCKAPEFVDIDVVVTYYIPKSRKDFAAAIQAATEGAYEAYLLWQQSKVGRDVNPSELNARIVNAGAKRTVIPSPAFQALAPDQSARVNYTALVYGGIEND